MVGVQALLQAREKMIRFPTNQLILEGPDCAGKSSLYLTTHKASGFTWNIQDRSWLSMLIYGITYGRDVRRLSRGLWEELTCLNNRVFLVMPPWETVAQRFQKRGDDFQTLETLQKLYDKFDNYRDELQHLPNFNVIDNTEFTAEEMGEVVAYMVKQQEESGLDEIAATVLRFTSSMPSTRSARDCEATLSFTFYDDCDFDEDDPSIMQDTDEGEYYTGIKDRVLRKIEDELAGNNEYNRAQTDRSRRFVYTDDSCISFIQIMFRDNVMDVHTVCRSSNVAKTFHKDLKFIYHLASAVYHNFGEFPVDEVRFRFNLNSAHLVQY